MEEKKVSQAELARIAGVSPGAVSHFLTEKRKRPRRDIIVRLANALSVTVDYLEGDEPTDKLEDYLRLETVRNLVESFVQLPPADQQRVVEMVRLMKETAKA